MHRAPITLAIAVFMLSACGGTKEDTQVTETRMDDIDSLEGTISDDPINMDASTDEAPIEAVSAPTDAPKARLDKAQAKESGGPEKAEIQADEPPAE